MTTPAKITVLQGPDEGKEFPFIGEMVNLGRGAENEVDLSDESLEEYQASIVRKNGRFAIYTPLKDGVTVDGSGIPSDQWIWLPETAVVNFRESTVLRFSSQPKAGEKSAAAKSADPPSTPPPVKRKKSRPKRMALRKEQPERRGRKVAKFITDQQGDRLVRLGEDGTLPELSLTENTTAKKAPREKREGGSPLIYVAVIGSLLMSLAMLFIDADPGGSTASQRAEARREIRKFYGSGENLKPYQRYLREARRAHSSGDRRAELRAYQRVLDELNAEDVVRSINGLTGDKDEDAELRRLIGVLLNSP